jgi:hypothetical protein
VSLNAERVEVKMSEQVRLNHGADDVYQMRKDWVESFHFDAHADLPGLLDDYDALHAEAEALREALEGMLEYFPEGASDGECLAVDAARAALSAQQSDPWAPSDADYDHAIHRNPDAKAWADFFVYTFPGLADKRELMISWFANAMMAMHDHLKAQQPEFCCEHSYKVAKQAAWGARDLTQCKCDHNEYCEHCWPDDFKEGGKWHNGFEAKQSAPEAK